MRLMGLFSEKFSTVDDLVAYMEGLDCWNELVNLLSTSKYDQANKEEISEDRVELKRSFYISDLVNLTYINNGSYRVVLDAEKFAVKIPVEAAGGNENFSDSEVYSEATKLGLSQYFPKFYHMGDGYCIVEKVGFFGSIEEFEPYIPEALRILNLLEIAGLKIEDISETRFDQWGLRGKDLVVVDSGSV